MRPDNRISAVLFAVLVVLLSGCAGNTPSAATPEVRSGALQGYLAKGEWPDSLALLPPPPAKGSAGFAMDESISKNGLALRDTPRFVLAREDAERLFPGAGPTFSCALGVPISEETTPQLCLLLSRMNMDLGAAVAAAKTHYQRERPFMENECPTCTPEAETHLRHSGSYPSGHTALGWAWALVLTEIAPDRADALLRRGRMYGESRIVCNAHWYSDIVGGRMIGAATVARLHGSDAFLKAVKAAREEVRAVRARGLVPQRNCAGEQKILATPLPLQ